jgi:hypothetical protein
MFWFKKIKINQLVWKKNFNGNYFNLRKKAMNLIFKKEKN